MIPLFIGRLPRLSLRLLRHDRSKRSPSNIQVSRCLAARIAFRRFQIKMSHLLSCSACARLISWCWRAWMCRGGTVDSMWGLIFTPTGWDGSWRRLILLEERALGEIGGVVHYTRIKVRGRVRMKLWLVWEEYISWCCRHMSAISGLPLSSCSRPSTPLANVL